MQRFYSGDPVRDAELHNAKQERELARFPVCEYRNQPISEDKACRIGDEWWHTDCIVEQFEVCIDEYFD